MTRDRLRRVAGLAVVILLAVVATGWRLNALKLGYQHPDEVIAVSVVQRVLNDRTLDTNWARTNVPERFRSNQYNFSAYYLFASAFEAAATWIAGPAQDLGARLRGLSVFLGGLVVLLAGLLGLRLGGFAAGITAALFTGVCVTLFQDSIYARPEAFSSILVLTLLLLATSPRGKTQLGLVVAGFLVGLLVATKLTYLVLVPFPLIANTLQMGSGRARRLPWRGYFVAVGMGAFLGAPYAALNPGEFIRGVEFLVDQYSGGHWPHGVHDGGLLDRLMHSASYLSYAIGLSTILLACIGSARFVVDRNFAALTLIFGVIASALYFLQTRAFFERNLSHALPVLFVLAGAGVGEVVARLSGRRPIAGALAAILLALVAAWSPAQVTKKLTSQSTPLAREVQDRALEARLAGEGFLLLDVGYRFERIEELSRKFCGRAVFKLIDFGDRYTAATIESMLGSNRLTLLQRLSGPFHGSPTSTLHTYHAADVVYLALADRPDELCPVRFEPIDRPASAYETTAAIRFAGAAAEGGLPQGAVTMQWGRPVYSTWFGSDRNVGEVQIGPFEACGDVLFPVFGGVRAPENELTIAEKAGAGWRYLFAGSVPEFRQGWSLVRLSRAEGECRALWIRLVDRSTEWGQWVGIGAPVTVAH